METASGLRVVPPDDETEPPSTLYSRASVSALNKASSKLAQQHAPAPRVPTVREAPAPRFFPYAVLMS